MHIQIWSDFVCPFCYIGESNLRTALADFPHKDDVTVEFKSFLLTTDATYDPEEAYVETFAKLKQMTVEEAREALANVTRMARNVGLTIDYDQAKYADSSVAHLAFQYAKKMGLGNAFYSRLFKAFFEEGALLSDEDSIVRLGVEIGLDEKGLRENLSRSALIDEVNEDLQMARSIGVQGVPFFVIDNKYALSGAQPAGTFRDVLDDIWAKEYS